MNIKQTTMNKPLYHFLTLDDEDVKRHVWGYLRPYICMRKVNQSIQENLKGFKHRRKLLKQGKYDTSKVQFDLMRYMLKKRIGRDREPLQVQWITPIDKMHARRYYIAGMLGVSKKPLIEGDHEKIRFYMSYRQYQRICKENNWEPLGDHGVPHGAAIWGGENIFLRDLMNKEEGLEDTHL